MNPSAGISVVIPCFNAEKFVVAAVESVLAQDWPLLQVIVVDDGSTDGSSAALRSRFGPRNDVTVLTQPNAGVAAARNQGIRHAAHDWVAFLDADDVWLPGKLQVQQRCLNAAPTARMACTAWKVWTAAESASTAATMVTSAPGPSGWIYPQLLLDCVVWTSTVLAHRSVFDEIGTFDEHLRIGEDWDLWLRASRVTPILNVSEPFALYRMHASNVTRAAVDENFHNVVVSRALSRWGYAAPDGRVASKRDVDHGLARSWADFAGSQLAAGHLQQACHGAWMSLRVEPRYVPGWKLLAKAAVRSLAGATLSRG